MEDYIAQAWYLLAARTPLPVDCGPICGRACCRQIGGEVRGMRLFPGEKERLQHMEGFRFWDTGDGGTLVECGGHCKRSARPLACRLFPLFPHLDEAGRVRAVYDPRAWRLCPLVRQAADIRLDREFVRAVRTAGRLLTQDEACRAFLLRESREIDEINRFLRLEEQRGPLCRRKGRHHPHA